MTNSSSYMVSIVPNSEYLHCSAYHFAGPEARARAIAFLNTCKLAHKLPVNRASGLEKVEVSDFYLHMRRLDGHGAFVGADWRRGADNTWVRGEVRCGTVVG